MSEAAPTDSLAPRVTAIETAQARSDERLRHVERTVDECSEGIRKLLDRDARRAPPMNVRTIAGTVAAMLGGLVALGGLVFWFVAQTPAVSELGRAHADLVRTVAAMQVEREAVAQRVRRDSLVRCLLNEIANQHTGWHCAHPERRAAAPWEARIYRRSPPGRPTG